MLDDLRLALRSLRSTPGFTTVALVVLALGIGSATAIFSVVDAVLLKGLPYDQHDRLAAVYEKDTKRPTTFGEGYVTPQTYLDWRSLQQPFQAIAAAGFASFRLTTSGGEPADAPAQRVSWEFFPVLRVAPLIGRAFTARDEVEGAAHVAILSYGFWQQRYGGTPDIVGKTVDLDEESWQIVGVMPRSFTYPVGAARPAQILVPRVFAKNDHLRGSGHGYNDVVMARLKDGLTFRQASDEMFHLSEQLDAQFPKWSPGRRALVVPLHDRLVGKARGWMLMLLGAVMLVLLIACANVANLLLVRATSRIRDVSIRAALGATAWRLIRALLAEGLLLACTGASAGVGLAYAGVTVLRAWLPARVPRVAAINIDLRVLGIAVAVTIATGVLFGIVPAFQLARPDLTRSLKDGGRSATAGKGAQRIRNVLVIVEVAIAVVLLVGAILFTASFIQLIRIDPGFDYHNVLTLGISLRLPRGAKFDAAFAARSRAYIEHAVEAIRHVPGVEAVGTVAGGLPLTGNFSRTDIQIPGGPEATSDDDFIDRRTVSRGYLQLLSVPLVQGRFFTSEDRSGSQPVAIVNRTAARKYWPHQNPVGQHVSISHVDRIVVGVVGDIHHYGPELPPRQEAYIPFDQEPDGFAALVIRTSGDPLNSLAGVKAAIWSINPDQHFTSDTVTLEQYMDRLIAERRFNMALLALFGAVGLIIATVGIYGVMAYVVAQRTTEIGVRMALGAPRVAIVAMVLKRAGSLVGAGLAIGTVGSWYLTSVVRTFLFEIRPNDLRMFAAALSVLTAAALLATAVPARRAAGVDPLRTLRMD